MDLALRLEHREQADEPGLRATFFGDFTLFFKGEDVRPRSRKCAALLAYLIASDHRSASRTRLASLFWSDRGEAQARASLRQAIAELRAGPAALSRALIVSRQDISLAAKMVISDLDRLADGIGRLDAQELACAVEEISGDFLADLNDLSPAFDEWLQIERIRQRERLLDTILEVIPRLTGTAGQEVGRLLAATERIDPLNEAVVRLRLERAHAVGDTASLHRCYRRLVDSLSRELSVAPARATRELFEHLLASGERTAVVDTVPIVRPRLSPIVIVGAFHGADSDEAARAASNVAEDVRISLARSSALRVQMADRGDVINSGTTTQDAIAVYLLSGSVRIEAELTTVNVQLGALASGLLIWSAQMRVAAASRTSIDELVARVAGSVRVAVERDVVSLEAGGGAVSLTGDEVTLLYALGRRLVRDARTLASAQESADLLNRVMQIEPRHVGARLRLAQLYNTDFQHLVAGHDVAGFRSRAFALTKEAAEFEPADVQVQLRLAWCYLRRREWERAERMLRAAAEAMPHDADALNECGFGLAHLGELNLAETLIQRAFELNPFAPVEYHADLAVLLALDGRRAAAEEHFEVCSEHRLLYQMVRLGNLHALGGQAPRLAALQQRFVGAFFDIWQPPGPPTFNDVAEWIDYTLCLKKPAHRHLIVQSAQAAWHAFAPAISDNSS